MIDADQVAREVVAKGSEGLKQIISRWGEDLLTPQGDLDRLKLAQRIFQDPKERAALEAITHPKIMMESARQIQEALSPHAHPPPPLVVYDAALLIESKRADAFRPLVVVYADPAVQRARLCQRDQITDQEAQSRLDAQLPIKEKVAFADYVIDNSKDWATLDAQIDELWSRLTTV